MGHGKTTMAIEYINKLPDDVRIIYITPYLDEVERIIYGCQKKQFVQPKTEKGYGSKMSHLIKLVWEGRNIVSTHALLSNITDELITALRAGNYILFLDEVFQTVNKFDLAQSRNRKEVDDITRKDVETLLSKDIISVQDDFSVQWTSEEYILSKYEGLKRLADRGLLYLVNGALLLWAFPIEVFREGIFDEIYILTYQFDAQLQAYYYKYFDIVYEMYEVYGEYGDYKIRKKDADNQSELNWIKSIRDKIHIVDNSKMNALGDYYYDRNNRLIATALSKNWYRKNPDAIPIIKRHAQNFFTNIAKTNSDHNMWTSFKDDTNKFRGRGLSMRNWVALNARATNNYAHKTSLAYLVNRYIDPFYDDFFEKKGIRIDSDKYALSELLQWIWRSGIRNGKEIDLYIPSKRMRDLLEDFLEKE
jgi:hypothetical protein